MPTSDVSRPAPVVAIHGRWVERREEGTLIVNVRHHSIRFSRVLLVCMLILIVIVLVSLALEPVLRLAMFLGVVAPHLPASGS